MWINSGSLLLHSKDFEGDKRIIYLNGEATFHVVHDPGKPFIVKTNHMEVEVVGTSFNIEAYPDSEFTIATLESGKIKVKLNQENEFFYLKPDEQILYNYHTGKIETRQVNASKVMEWKEGYLLFRDADFDYIVHVLEHKFDVTFQYEKSEFAGKRFNVKFKPDESLNDILEVLKRISPDLKYRIEGNLIYIIN